MSGEPVLGLFEISARLLTAGALGALIGIERELRHKSAGLRTSTLIGLGAALFTISSIQMAAAGGDPGRIAAQIVTGIGFLGGGAILHSHGAVTGLTTAATIWVNAAVGMAAGSGHLGLALAAAGTTLAVLVVLHPVERYFERRRAETLGGPRLTTDLTAKPGSSGPGAAAG